MSRVETIGSDGQRNDGGGRGPAADIVNGGGTPAPLAATPAIAASATPLRTTQPTFTGPGMVDRVRRITSTLRRIIGAPDYQAYLAHREKFHPGCPVLTEQEFIAERLVDRYSRPGSRCC